MTEAAAPSEIEPLLAERTRLMDAELAARDAIRKLEPQANSAAAFDGELAAIAAREAQDAREWAEAGVQGEAPGLRLDERTALESRASEARARAAAAMAAISELTNKLHAASQARSAVEGKIETAAVALLDGELAPMLSELESIGQRQNDLLLRLTGTTTPIVDLAHVRERRELGSGRALFVWAEQVTVKIAATRPTYPPQELQDKARADWSVWLVEKTAGVVGATL